MWKINAQALRELCVAENLLTLTENCVSSTENLW
nr:MAG TPA: hypothetical protein [Caudoviricetes sp.]